VLIRNGSQEQSEVPRDPRQSTAIEQSGTDIDGGLGSYPLLDGVEGPTEMRTRGPHLTHNILTSLIVYPMYPRRFPLRQVFPTTATCDFSAKTAVSDFT
jgi:hypothetical protein